MSWRVALLLTAALALATTEKLRRYDDYRVYRALPTCQEQLEFLAGLEDPEQGILFWKEPVSLNRAADIMVSPWAEDGFLGALAQMGIKASVFVDNVQKLIDNQRPARRPRASFGWDDYHTIEEIYAWLDTLPEEFPGVAEIVVAGQSYEGREIIGVKISHAPGNPAVVVEGGVHALEWITVASPTWFIYDILTTNDSAIRSIVRQYDFYIFPNTNPDGYAYTWTTDRMWRKTRTPYTNVTCSGADANRNWDFYWGEEDSSNDTCAFNYAGPEPFSEIESRSFSEFLTGLGEALQVYFCYHAYAQMILFPYGTPKLVAPNYDELRGLVERAGEALALRYGTQYQVGNIVEVMNPTTGVSMDWVTGVLGKRYAFVYELPDTGEYGYFLPADRIVPTSEETWDSMLSILVDVIPTTRLNNTQPLP